MCSILSSDVQLDKGQVDLAGQYFGRPQAGPPCVAAATDAPSRCSHPASTARTATGAAHPREQRGTGGPREPRQRPPHPRTARTLHPPHALQEVQHTHNESSADRAVHENRGSDHRIPALLALCIHRTRCRRCSTPTTRAARHRRSTRIAAATTASPRCSHRASTARAAAHPQREQRGTGLSTRTATSTTTSPRCSHCASTARTAVGAAHPQQEQRGTGCPQNRGSDHRIPALHALCIHRTRCSRCSTPTTRAARTGSLNESSAPHTALLALHRRCHTQGRPAAPIPPAAISVSARGPRAARQASYPGRNQPARRPVGG